MNRTVYGEGPIPCVGAIIGQNPGYEEVEQERPFVGPSGRLLNDLLTEVHLRREDLYVSNVVKVWTPNNREPTGQEIADWLDYLKDELARVQPKAVLALGNIAFKVLTGGRSGIEKYRGKELYTHKDFGSVPLLVAPHPSASFKKPKYKPMLREDLRLFAQRLGALAKEIPMEWEIVRTWEETT